MSRRIVINNKFFKSLSLIFNDNDFICICGENGSGKTLLLSFLEQYLKLSQKVNLVGDNININIDSGYDQFKKVLGINDAKAEIIKKIVKELNLTYIYKKKFNTLNPIDQQKILISVALVDNPEILLLDNCFYLFKEKDKILFVDYLKKMNITTFMVTHNMEDALFCNRIICLKKFRIIYNGNRESLFDNDRLTHQAGLNKPFIHDLCNNLKYYNLIKEDILDIDMLIGELWK